LHKIVVLLKGLIYDIINLSLKKEKKMINIQFDNPSIEQYIKEIGKENLENMILSFLEIKAKLNQTSKIKSTNNSHDKVKEFGISKETHNKILALKATQSSNSKSMNRLRTEISNRLKDTYKNLSINAVRDDYFRSKGYL